MTEEDKPLAIRSLLKAAREHLLNHEALDRAEFAAALSDTNDAQVRAEAYAEMVTCAPHTCEYGHRDCAAWAGGPCSDQMLSEADLGD